MKDLLFVKKLHIPVFATQARLSNEEWNFEHQQVSSFIIQYL